MSLEESVFLNHTPIRITQVSPTSPEVCEMIRQLDAYQAGLYPPESNHLDEPAELSKPNVYFIGAYLKDQIVGIGAVKKIQNTYGEIKRMFVAPQHRGSGVARIILSALERHLQAHHITLIRLETGIHQPEAIAFYQKHGFQKSSPFGDYREDAQSLYLEKHLGSQP